VAADDGLMINDWSDTPDDLIKSSVVFLAVVPSNRPIAISRYRRAVLQGGEAAL